MNDLLINIQKLSGKPSEGLEPSEGSSQGAIPGSFPLWGKYEPFAFPNWATKYFADSLMLEINCK